MKKSLWLSCILLVFVQSTFAKVLVAGVKDAAACSYATEPLTEDLKDIGFPKDWTIVVACDQLVWEKLQRKGDAFRTSTAFTNLAGHITVVNGAIYLQMFPLRGTRYSTPKEVLEHENGHIRCKCNDEGKADKAAGL